MNVPLFKILNDEDDVNYLKKEIESGGFCAKPKAAVKLDILQLNPKSI